MSPALDRRPATLDTRGMDRDSIIRAQIDEAARLRAAGPPTDAYLRWRDRSAELLTDFVGAGHPLRAAFQAAVGPIDPLDSEGMQIEGAHGMAVRIDEGAQVLRRLLGEDGDAPDAAGV